MPNTPREFDIIVYGATGYTGRLVAEYLKDKSGLKWAMAGRSQAKLEEVRDLIGAPADTPLVVADADDPASLAAMAARAKVVLTTVGPYQLYGEPLVKACVEAGTDYTDLCGEPVWMRQMIDAYDEAAKKSGARITFSSGFDSIPFDLGVLMLQKHAVETFGAPAPRVKGRVRTMQGGFSGGTAASLKETLKTLAKNPTLTPYMLSSFGLTPGFEGPMQPTGMIPEYDSSLDSWAAPFIMAAINTKNVHRTNFLLGHPWGTDLRYDEMMLTSAGEIGKQAAEALAAALKAPFGGGGGPKPGEGPTKEERDSGSYDVLFVGEYPDGKRVLYSVQGDRDPGYGSTSKMIAETAIALTEVDGPGGVTTPGAALGEKLVERLQAHAGLTFAVEG
jgi:short subunit dehydrogenase-like uncharacterized protein